MFISQSNKVVVILGTTASGKTRLAIELSKKFAGEIISADSRQVYKGMDIGTGKDLKEYQISKFKTQNHHPKLKIKKIPYHLIDIINPKTKKRFSVAEFQKLAYESIDDIISRRKLPIICGGTGLYVDSIVKGIQFKKLLITDYEFRKMRSKLSKKSLPRLLSLLKRIDWATYKIIDRKNRRRVQRALEIYYETGIPKSAQQTTSAPPYKFLKIGITFPKTILASRIEKRLKNRLDEGMIKEVKKLHREGVSWKKLDDFGLEYRWVSRYLQGLISREEMEKELLKAIIHFAKRQMTWFKRDKEIYWIKGSQEAEKAVKKFLNF